MQDYTAFRAFCAFFVCAGFVSCIMNVVKEIDRINKKELALGVDGSEVRPVIEPSG